MLAKNQSGQHHKAILNNLPIPEQVARRMAKTRHWIPFNDLCQAAWVGYLEAIQRLRCPAKQGYRNYLFIRSTGALLDYSRNYNLIPWRKHKGKLIFETLENNPDAITSDSDIPDYIAIKTIRQAVHDLPSRERLVIESLFFYESEGVDVARQLNISEPRVSQLKNRAFKRLRERMNPSDEKTKPGRIDTEPGSGSSARSFRCENDQDRRDSA